GTRRRRREGLIRESMAMNGSLHRVSSPLLLVALGAWALGSCGTTGIMIPDEDAGLASDGRTACAQVAAADCARLDACRKNGVSVAFGTMERCLQRKTLDCANVLIASGSLWTVPQVQGCAQGLQSASCAEYLENRVTACYPPPGMLASGAACAFDAQC